MLSFLFSPLLGPLVVAAATITSRGCTGTISSLDDVADAVKCSNININSFTVPAGKKFALALLEGTTVNLNGDIAFGNMSWAGPLFSISGTSVTFNGNGHTLDGGGPFYWDGHGVGAGITKPNPMISLVMSGTFANTNVLNSPGQVIWTENPAPLTISKIKIDDSQGDLPNSQSGGKRAAANTDGFDIGSSDVTIENSSVWNQDDCLAIKRGSNIAFNNNFCCGSHGVSIGSIISGTIVSGISINNNTIINSAQALRIKSHADATGSTVKNVTYSGNNGMNLTSFGVIIDQSYPKILSTPGTGVQISDINFIGAMNTLSVASSARPVAVNCGPGACTGPWDWSSLQTTGGKSNFLNNAPALVGYTG